MKYTPIGGLPRPLPRVVFGAISLHKADAASFSLLDAVMRTGCYAFDTAAAYGDGASERVIGAWMAERGNRDQVLIIDKGAHPAGGRSRVDPRSIRADLSESLRRLKTDHVDLYLLHRDDPVNHVGPILEVLNELKAEGKLTLFGASNWSRQRLEKAREYAQARGLACFSVSSNQYSLAVQYDAPFPGTLSINAVPGDPEWAWYRKTQFPLLSWSSLARGFFSGKFTRDNLGEFSDVQSRISILCYAREDNFLRLDRVRRLAARTGSSVAQIALAYVFHQPLNCFAVTGSLNPAHFRQSVEALGIHLRERELAWLDLRADSPD